MVAYNFKSAFVNLIHEGKKRQTIRGHRKRHARPGEPIQLYRGMRTKKCLKLVDPDPICRSVEEIEISIAKDRLALYRFPAIDADWLQVSDEFAYADGFLNAAHFTQWWKKVHGLGTFEGVLIQWGER